MKFELSSELILTERIDLTVDDLRYGYESGFIKSHTVISVAVAEVIRGKKDRILLDLSALLNDEAERVPCILETLGRSDHLDNSSRPARKWLYFQLKAAFLQSDRLHDPLGVVEQIYADFDYPPSIAHLVRYMPIQSNEPEDEIGDSALMYKWSEFLVIEQKRLMDESRLDDAASE